MSMPFRFRANELGPIEPDALNDAMEAALGLEGAASDVQVRPSPAFSDRVMAAIALEPSPAPAGFLRPLRRAGVLGGFVESLRQAWASVGSGRPAFARAVAIAYVLLVATAGVSLAGAASFGAAGALGLLAPNHTVAPSTDRTDPTEAPEATQAPVVESDESSAEPSETPESSPDESKGPYDHLGGDAPEASDDRSDNSGPGGGGDDSSGPGSTDEPDASGDHSGSGGNGSGSDDASGSGGGSGSSLGD